MQDDLNTALKQRKTPEPRDGLSHDIIAKALSEKPPQSQHEQQTPAVAFFMFRPRYAYAVLGLMIVAAIAIIASTPESVTAMNTADPFNDISTYIVYDTLEDFTDLS